MKFSKDEKEFVIRWIDNQFADNQLFPHSCIVETEEGEPGVSSDHVKAYKAWRKTLPKRSAVRAWMDEWLDKDDKKQLKQALAGLRGKSE